jgi:adenosyl cobinamide kinase/adenosyl cobinamide phosphate guanylyltransferase
MNVMTLIVGESGSGKSSSARNLPPEETVILNTERKFMPFKDFKKFKNIDVSSVKKFNQVVAELAKDDGKYKYVVVDSLTSLTEIVNKYTEVTFNGFESWKQYNSIIYDTLQALKALPQQVFITAIPEHLEKSLGELKGYARVKGKELKYGGIEKELSIVLWTNLVEDDDGIVTDYLFDFKPNKHNTAKAPNELFTDKVPNDLLYVTNAIKEYYGDES